MFHLDKSIKNIEIPWTLRVALDEITDERCLVSGQQTMRQQH